MTADDTMPSFAVGDVVELMRAVETTRGVVVQARAADGRTIYVVRWQVRRYHEGLTTTHRGDELRRLMESSR